MRVTKKQRLLMFVAECGWTRIGEAEWHRLRAALPDVSAVMIQQVMHQAGVPVDAPWCGIRQHTFEELEGSLCEFSRVYAERPDLHTACREQVIAAKDRAKWLSIRATADEELRQRKATMADWMLIWLGDPWLFPTWAEAFRAAKVRDDQPAE